MRTFAPIMAGVGNMRYKTFLFWNILGGMFWTGIMIFCGYFLGSSIKDVDKFILPIIILIIIVSIIPIFLHLFRKNDDKSSQEGTILQ